MPAWSRPGTHSTASPCIRRQRASVSWIATVSAWPMCSTPVTLGGGRTMEKTGRCRGDGDAAAAAGDGEEEASGEEGWLVGP
eukprot:COSAG01_NODE_356_length_18316_cov_24.401493_12_plen_82_part_00